VSEPPRVTVSTPSGEESVRIHDRNGDVEIDGASFSFSVDTGGEQTDPEPEESSGEHSRVIVPVEDVPVEDTLRCEARAGARGVEFLLRREDDTVLAWRNFCPHEPDVPLDPGSGAIVTDTHLVCHKHGARFERGDGTCTHGPCAGKRLDSVDVEIVDGDVCLADDRYDSARVLG
jgi:nitrite reductase/ring-hydroxylating ferredoxin subunit